jgi:N-acetylmuramoyl-L-alanine amidase
VIHYSAAYADQERTAADIDRMHRARTPPFRCIGYHYFIRRDGTVEPGRPEHELGAHVVGQNAGKLGICWAGGLERGSGSVVGVNTMTSAQEASLIRLIRELLERFPQAKVVGHRDLAPTLCPGFDVIPWGAVVERPPAPVPLDIFASVAVWLASFRRAVSRTIRRAWWTSGPTR